MVSAEQSEAMELPEADPETRSAIRLGPALSDRPTFGGLFCDLNSRRRAKGLSIGRNVPINQ